MLGGADAPAAVLAHLTSGHGGRAELLEKTGGQWVRVAASGELPAAGDGAPGRPEVRAAARSDLVLVAGGQARPLTDRLLHGFAAQAAAALDRDRLRTQAAQAEALAEGNRMRTALLAAVSHDLRTPLASIKASVSTLRQTDVHLDARTTRRSCWPPSSSPSDRLDALIGNLLDMSRLTTGSLQPFLRPTAIDEVAPVALRGLDDGRRLQLKVPDDLPLVRTDPGLLERVLANLFANALAYSPPRTAPRAAGAPGRRRRAAGDRGPRPRGPRRAASSRCSSPSERLDARGGGAAGRHRRWGSAWPWSRASWTSWAARSRRLDTPGGGPDHAGPPARRGGVRGGGSPPGPAAPRPAQP